MLHSLAHLLIQAVALECGYAATAISERIYAGSTGYGILLYTGTPGSEGTLGGLVAVGRRIEHYLKFALELGRLCSNDPICAQHIPTDPARGALPARRGLPRLRAHRRALLRAPQRAPRSRARGLDRRRPRRGVLRRPVTDLVSAGPPGAPSIVMLPGLGPTALDDLASALEAGRLRAPFTRSAARRHVPEAMPRRDPARAGHPRIGNTSARHPNRGPAAANPRPRTPPPAAIQPSASSSSGAGPTRREPHRATPPSSSAALCSAARRSVLIANYAFDRALSRARACSAQSGALATPRRRHGRKSPSSPCASSPTSSARTTPEVREPRCRGSSSTASCHHFSAYSGPASASRSSTTTPAASPRTPAERAILHAKCVVIDDTQVFLTSANFTQAGQQRNLEAGLRLRAPSAGPRPDRAVRRADPDRGPAADPRRPPPPSHWVVRAPPTIPAATRRALGLREVAGVSRAIATAQAAPRGSRRRRVCGVWTAHRTKSALAADRVVIARWIARSSP
jgi:hypothetical protein